MILADRLYSWLSQGPTPDCDRILGAALPSAEPPWSERITRMLLQRGHEASWSALIGQYGQLTPEIRRQLQAVPDRMQAGITLAAKSSSPEIRANVLLALEDRPYARLAYLLPDALRDSTPQVRALAGRVLRKMADEFLAYRPRAGDKAYDPARHAQRKQLVRALEESLRTFDLHNRLEVLETCLWFARDFGDTLWERLTSRRSRAGVVTSEQLLNWDQPRLAHFLVSALRRRAWREVAGEALRTWKTVPQVSALLRENDLLDDPQIRRHLSSIQSPHWFTQVDDALTELSPDLRPLAPRWACHAGYRDTEKTALLSRWVHAPDARIHRAAVYALAEVDQTGARALLKQIADSDSPLACFARWCVFALDTELVRSAIHSGGKHRGLMSHSGGFDAIEQGEAEADCTMLWQACRRTPPSERGELIAALRENGDVWRPQLKAYLQSPDPRDRILVLQIISTEALALQFRHDLEPLLNDPVEGIRKLTQTLIRTLSRQPLPSRTAPLEPPQRGTALSDEAEDQARRELRTILEQLSTGAADPTDAELVGKVRELLQEVYTEPGALDAAGALEEDRS